MTDAQAEECFALDLVENFPPLGENIDFYYDGPEDFLAHVFFGIEVTREIVAAYAADINGVPIERRLDWRGVLGFLNRRLRSGDRAVGAVIGTSFLFQLPMPGQEGHGIVNELDDELARLFEVVRPNG
ncbi:hypothetical protein [Nocardiopsis sp. NRRL B-16309]|uniref:hypothetical protein n=1 Tax=Nocardiopsis sp. NRRL B-16309 TaxID=1519494 RepID=UPI0006AF5D10|nr:hypothetical protein [Nocardiopsis sp. NRRL B-16309]